MAITYTHPASGNYSETVATVGGAAYLVNTQYGHVAPLGQHARTCEQVTSMGGWCSCGLLRDVDVSTLVADARRHGLRGPAPMPSAGGAVVVDTGNDLPSPLTIAMDRSDSDL